MISLMEVALLNIRSVHNVASVFRTADAFGVSRVFLIGYTPTPVDRFGHVRSDFAKVSLGAENMVAWERCATFSAFMRKARVRNMRVIAIEQSSRARPLARMRNADLGREACVLVFGNEVRGISPQALAQCDAVFDIPMRGAKESLNVSVTAGIALFHAQFILDG